MTQSPANLHCKACGMQELAVLPIDNLPVSAQPFIKAPSSTPLSKNASLYLCDYCGHMFFDISPVSYYKSVIRSVSVSSNMTAYRRQQFKSLSLLFDKLPSDIKVLEIGAGNGQYAMLLAEIFPICYATEKDSSNIATSSFKYIDTHPDDDDFDVVVSPYGPFDLVCCFSYLEHLPDPATTLKIIDSLLSPGGYALIEVPNSDYIRKNGLLSEAIPDHLHYFTAKSLLSMVSPTRLNLHSLEPTWSNYILSLLFTKLENATSVSSRLQNIHQSLICQINILLSLFSPDAKVAVWGAGHQSLFTLVSTSLFLRVDYVIDSSEAKQGQYIPGINIEISPPSILEYQPITLLIIICAGYNDEVVSYVRNTCLPCPVHVYSIRDSRLIREQL